MSSTAERTNVFDDLKCDMELVVVRNGILFHIRAIEQSLETWTPSPDLFFPTVSDIIHGYYDGCPTVTALLACRVGIDITHALNVYYGGNVPEVLTGEAQVRQELVLDIVGANPGCTTEMLAHPGLPEAIKQSLTALSVLEDRFHTLDRVSDLLNYDAFGLLDPHSTNLLEVFKNEQRWHQGFLRPSNKPGTYLWVGFSSHYPEDEYEILRHIDVTAFAFTENGPTTRMTMMLEVAQIEGFTNADYYNAKDSMDGESAAFAHQLLQSLDTIKIAGQPIQRVCNLFHVCGGIQTGMLHWLEVETFASNVNHIARGVELAQMAAEVITGGSKALTSDAWNECSKIEALATVLKERQSQESYALLPACDAISVTWVHSPARHLQELRAILSQGDDQGEGVISKHEIETLIDTIKHQSVLMQAIASAYQSNAQNGGQVRHVDTDRTSFGGEMARLAFYNRH